MTHHRHPAISDEAMLRKLRIALNRQIDDVFHRDGRIAGLRRQLEELKLLIADFSSECPCADHPDGPPASRRRRQRLARRSK